jgi:hypothetical protein
LAQYSDSQKLAVAFFNALNKQLTEGSQYPFESIYRSLPNIPNDVVWSDTVSYAVNATAADNFATANPTIVKKYTLKSLTAIPGSNNQAWYIDDAGQFVNHWIAPSDIPDSITNNPSFGYQATLYTGTNTLITPTQGKWNIFYAQGIILFEAGFTPVDMGWGTPKVTCYTYVGNKGGGGSPSVPQVDVTAPASSTSVITTYPTASLLSGKFLISIKDSTDSEYVSFELLVHNPPVGAIETTEYALLGNFSAYTMAADISLGNLRIKVTNSKTHSVTVSLKEIATLA